MTASDSPATTGTRPTVLFVLGMGRSGTAALTRVLSLCGGALPPGMLGAMAGNPRGYWEPRQANVLNEGILRRRGSTLFDPCLRLLDEGDTDATVKAACIEQISAYIKTFPAAPLVVIKELRITVLSSEWFEAVRLAGFNVAAVIAVRHPQEVIESVGERTKASPELSAALWLKYTLLAERHTRGLPRVVVEYANLLDDWRREVKRISAALEIDLDNRDECAIDEFLTPDLRRHRRSGTVTEPFGTDWVSKVYEVFCAAARDEPLDEATVDGVFEAYRGSADGFRTAFEDLRRFTRLNRIVRTSIWKVGYDALGVLHQRNPTWD